jgi:phenylacetate-CoA ligase
MTVEPWRLEPFRDQFQAALFGSVPDHIDRLTWDRARVEAHQLQRLRALLAVAIERSPFHARRLSGIDPTTFELADLARLPVMTKAEMMHHFDDVVTDRRLTRATAEATITATGNMPRPIDGELVVLASGGSSGTRGLFAFDATAFAEYAASLIRPVAARRAAAGQSTGPTVIVAAASAIHATGAAPPLLAGSPLPFVSVPVTLPLADIVSRLNELQPGTLFGYPSILAVLAAEQLAGRLQISPASVTANSEMLLHSHRVAIHDAFAVPAANSYGSSEGLVGAAAPGHRTITFASDCCIAELVDQHGNPVPPGTTSAAVLITNLFNTVQPLIRYRLEDNFTPQPDAADHGHLRADVDGRSATIFQYGDVTVHPLVIATPLTAHPDIVDYQIRQRGRGIAVDVLSVARVDQDRLTRDLRAALADAGLTDPSVEVRVVPGLRRDVKTGKLTQFVAA